MRIPFQIVSENKQLMGIMHIAETQLITPKVIIMSYGLNGNRVEQHRMSVKLGEVCEKGNINLVRFDYTNVGISEGEFENSTIAERVKNVIDVSNFINGCFNGECEISFIGFSDGCKVVSRVYTLIDNCKNIVLWNPIINIPVRSKQSGSNINKGNLVMDKQTHKLYKPLYGLKLNVNIIREMTYDNSIDYLKKEKNKLIIFGSKDLYTSDIRGYFEENRIDFSGLSISLVEGAGHLFNCNEYENEVIEKTVNYIKCE